MKDNKEIIISGSVEQQSLIKDLRQIIEQARGHVAATANYELTMMYWHIGERINREVLGNQRAEYGKQIVAQVAQQLQAEFGKKGFEERTIRRMMQFAQMFPDIQIVSPLVSKLSWSHFLIVMPLKDELQREFYLTMAASERWSKRTLQAKIDGMLFERTAIATKPDELIKKELSTLRDNDVMSPDLVFMTFLKSATPQRILAADENSATVQRKFVLSWMMRLATVVELTLPKDANVYAQQYALCLPDKALLKQKLREMDCRI